MNENMNDGTAKATARRRLIRGAFVAPAALTLYSGNVFAASSNNLRALNAGEYPAPVTNPGSTDTWIRVRVYLSGDVKVVSANDIANEGSNLCGSTVTTSTAWVTVATPPVGHNPAGTVSETQEFAALRFDNMGRIIGVIPAAGGSTGGGTALTRSAGTSLKGACPI